LAPPVSFGSLVLRGALGLPVQTGGKALSAAGAREGSAVVSGLAALAPGGVAATIAAGTGVSSGGFPVHGSE
jgi:hypothetical protein